MVAQLKPDGGRSRLLSRRSRVGADAAVLRHAVPRTDVTALDQRLPLRLVKPSPRGRELGHCRNSYKGALGVSSISASAGSSLGDEAEAVAAGVVAADGTVGT